MEIILVIIATLALFLAMILLLAAKPKFAGTLTGAFIAIAGVGGLVFYGYGFASVTHDVPLAVIRALLAVCGMYVGKMDMGSVSAAPGMERTEMQVLFWIVHLLALYATASAAITTVGAEALRKLRLWLARRGQLHLIYGVNDETLSLGKKLLAKKTGAVVFIDNKPDASLTAAIARAGCVLRTDDSALKAEDKFIKGIGANRKSRKITLYAMESDPAGNVQYATKFLKAMERHQIHEENICLIIRGKENSAAASLQALGEKYGYHTVNMVQEATVAARILVQNYPPCDTVTFDETGKARENFETLIVGFGQIGQAVLLQLVMNGQFAGSTFRADVFAPDCEKVMGYFSRKYQQVIEQYHVVFHSHDARSQLLYDHLAQRGSMLKYIVLCTGSDKLNQEIAEELADYCENQELHIPIYLCTHRGVKAFDIAGRTTKFHSLYHPDVLNMQELDSMAMLINHHYQGDPDCGPAATWRDCDYFSRMSCRAAADFVPAMLRMAGKTAEEIACEGWKLDSVQMENLSRAEHDRWCAFHFCMGFAPMSREEFMERAELYRSQLAAGQTPIRVGKNLKERTHACLVSWEDLEELARREQELTGRTVNYQQMDTENLLMIPKLLKQAQSFKG